MASLCEVSEELKQDGGSSRGSGDGVGNAVPKATSGTMEHEHNTRSRFITPSGSVGLLQLNLSFKNSLVLLRRRSSASPDLDPPGGLSGLTFSEVFQLLL